jgi:carboxybiotin decarboxylase
MIDFGPLIANPRTLLFGGAAQFGIFGTFVCAPLLGFDLLESASIGIIGGADGPTSIFTTTKLAPHLLGPIAVAAYSYMALVPLIQPPIMKLLTTEAERKIKMKTLRKVSQFEKIAFAVVVMVFCILVVPDAAPLIAMLFTGNLLRECKVTERLVKAAQNEIINIVTIFLGLCVGLKMGGMDPRMACKPPFLNPRRSASSPSAWSPSPCHRRGVLMAKLMNVFSRTRSTRSSAPPASPPCPWPPASPTMSA